jgi:L-arabinose isomerase
VIVLGLHERLAVQRLMRDGYGFGAEGDWKTAAMVRAMKVMASGLPGGVSFMEDYTYHFAESGDLTLGAHMLEVCESIAAGRPKLEVHPLSIGGKADPVRLVFDAHPGVAVLASITDMGQRFRMLATVVDVVAPPHPLPRLPVARAMWRPRPDLATNAAGWIYAGGSHHTSLGFAVTPEQLADFASMSGIEFVLIDEETRLDAFRDRLRWNDLTTCWPKASDRSERAIRLSMRGSMAPTLRCPRNRGKFTTSAIGRSGR